MKPILLIGTVVGVMCITIGAFMYFNKLDNSVIANREKIDYLQKNDSIFLVISRKFQLSDSLSRRDDSIKLELLNQLIEVNNRNHDLLIQLSKTIHK